MHPLAVKYRIGIVISIFGRYDLTVRMLDSINNSDLSDTMVILVDESNSRNSPVLSEHDRQISDNVMQYPLKADHLKIFKGQHGNINHSLLIGFDLLKNVYQCQYLVILDSDTIVKKHWLRELLNAGQYLDKNYPNVPYLVSGFATINGGHCEIGRMGPLRQMNDLGGINWLFPSQQYEQIRPMLFDCHFDNRVCNWIKKRRGYLCCTVPSVVEHIGYIGLHSQPKLNIDGMLVYNHDVSVDFYWNKNDLDQIELKKDSRLIHRLNLDLETNESRSYLLKFKQYHYQYLHVNWTDSEIESLLTPTDLEIYCQSSQQIKQTMAVKHILWNYGGFYVNQLVECLQSLDPLLNYQDHDLTQNIFFTDGSNQTTNYTNYANYIMYGSKRCPLNQNARILTPEQSQIYVLYHGSDLTNGPDVSSLIR